MTGVDVVQASAGRGARRRSTARDGRRFEAALVVAADGVHSVIARRLGLNRGWPRRVGRARHDGRDAALRAPRRRSVDDVGGLRLRPAEVTNAREPRSRKRAELDARRGRIRLHLPEARSRQRRHRVRAVVLPRRVERRRTSCSASFVAGLRDTRRDRRGVGPAKLHPVPDSGRRAAAPSRAAAACCWRAMPADSSTPSRPKASTTRMVSGDLAARAIIETPGAAAGNRLARRYRRACDDEIGSELRDSVLVQRYLFADRRRMAQMISRRGSAPGDGSRLCSTSRSADGPMRRSAAPHVSCASPQLAVRLMWERAGNSRWRAVESRHEYLRPGRFREIHGAH